MTCLFHVTLRRNIPSIMKHGLIPHKQPNYPFGERKVVFFWSNLALAKSICLEDEVVIEVQIHKNIKIDKLWNGAFNVYERLAYIRFDPSNLKVIYDGKTDCDKNL